MNQTVPRNLQVLLVEDNDDTRELLSLLLESAGHRVHAVGSVAAALHEFQGLRGDVLISDLSLPDGSGLDLIRELRSQGQTLYAVALSGFGTPADRASSIAAGFNRHMNKPIELDELERMLDAVP